MATRPRSLQFAALRIAAMVLVSVCAGVVPECAARGTGATRFDLGDDQPLILEACRSCSFPSGLRPRAAAGHRAKRRAPLLALTLGLPRNGQPRAQEWAIGAAIGWGLGRGVACCRWRWARCSERPALDGRRGRIWLLGQSASSTLAVAHAGAYARHSMAMDFSG
jgi:hypothetical protein